MTRSTKEPGIVNGEYVSHSSDSSYTLCLRVSYKRYDLIKVVRKRLKAADLYPNTKWWGYALTVDRELRVLQKSSMLGY